jgi:hypothetical protein
MSLHSRNRRGLLAVLLFTALAVLCSLGTIASAQDQPAPKWELFGGYSFFDPAADIHGVLPGGAVSWTHRWAASTEYPVLAPPARLSGRNAHCGDSSCHLIRFSSFTGAPGPCLMTWWTPTSVA